MLETERWRWTAEEDRLLITAVKRGSPTRSIVLPGRTSKAIANRLSQLGIRQDRLSQKSRETGYSIRKCLSCKKPFGSEHVGNRIYLPCKRTIEYLAA